VTCWQQSTVVLLISDVRLKNYGSTMIEVIDNGYGVDEANFQALSTSQFFPIFMHNANTWRKMSSCHGTNVNSNLNHFSHSLAYYDGDRGYNRFIQL